MYQGRNWSKIEHIECNKCITNVFIASFLSIVGNPFWNDQCSEQNIKRTFINDEWNSEQCLDKILNYILYSFDKHELLFESSLSPWKMCGNVSKWKSNDTFIVYIEEMKRARHFEMICWEIIEIIGFFEVLPIHYFAIFMFWIATI